MKVEIIEDKIAMGKSAAEYVASELNKIIVHQGYARIILATGTSQFDFLVHLKTLDIPWHKITVFHLDEYIGIDDQHPASFRKYLKERIIDDVKPRAMHYLNASAEDIPLEIKRYEALLKEKPIDIACIGIGENGHIAFNDPPVAEFDDPHWVKVVALDDACRNQQLGEGWFLSLAEVPTHALTLTIPAIMHSKIISCAVPDQRKAEAVKNTLRGEISTDCPASILRTHPDCTLWLDRFSAPVDLK